MSGKGNRYDNAMVETFFEPLDAELAWRTNVQNRAKAMVAIGRIIDGSHNPVRRHSAIDFIPASRRKAGHVKPNTLCANAKPVHTRGVWAGGGRWH